MRCDVCGKFAERLNDVWCIAYWNGISHQACDDCFSSYRAGGETP